MTVEQKQLIIAERHKCWKKIAQSIMEAQAVFPRRVEDGTLRCPMVWDNAMCWEEAPAGTMQRQRCPEYIKNMDHSGFAYRYCDTDGQWFYHETYNNSWTNYTDCLLGGISTSRADTLHLIQSIGYGISLISLIIAVLIMCLSRLKSKSNTIHVNLFLAFILRAGASFLKQLLFVQDLGLEKDLNRTAEGKISFIEEGLHWECRLLYTVFMYSVCVSQIWIFMEGLYLHMLIYRTLSTERNGVRPYIVLGWVLPFAILVPWIIVKANNDNILCWNLNSKTEYLWIMHGPLFTTVLLNFFFFLNICRVLCMRARSNQRHAGQAKYRQLAKFILVLIPLFGVMYVIFGVESLITYSDRHNFTSMLAEQTYNAFQGFILALLFCFLNEEVHNEMKRIWWRRRTRRRDSALTRSFMLSSFRRGNSYAPRGTSNKAIHPLRTPSCRGSGANSGHTGKEQLPWPVRLKKSVLQLLGRNGCKKDSLMKSSSDTPPFMVGDNGLAGLTRAEQEEVEMRRNLTLPNHQQQDLEDISG